MQKEQHMQKERISEAGKSFMIFVLVVIMLLLLVLLALEQNAGGEAALPFDDRMVVYQSGASGFSHGMDVSRLSPVSVAWRGAPGRPMYCVTASSASAKVYASLFSLLREVLGDGAVCRILPDEEGKTVWDACRSQRFLYLSYLSDLPSAVIRAYTVSDEDSSHAAEDVTAKGDAVYIKELFFLEKEDHSVYAVSRDCGGGVAVFEPETSLHTEALSAYIDTVSTQAAGSALKAVFYADAGTLYENSRYRLSADAGYGGDTALLFTETRTFPAISVTVPDPSALLFAEEPDAEALLGGVLALLGMRDRDTGNYYTDTAGGRVYLNAEGRLTIAADGTIRYAAIASGGLPVSDYLGYSSVSGSYSLAEYLRTADRLLTKLYSLSPALCGGRALPVLTDVSRSTDSGGRDVVSLRYCYQRAGTPLLRADGTLYPALTMTIRDARIHTLALSMLSAADMETETYLLSPSVVLSALEWEQTGGGNSGAQASGQMSLFYVPAGTGEMRVEWIFRTEAPRTKGGRIR